MSPIQALDAYQVLWGANAVRRGWDPSAEDFTFETAKALAERDRGKFSLHTGAFILGNAAGAGKGAVGFFCLKLPRISGGGKGDGGNSGPVVLKLPPGATDEEIEQLVTPYFFE